MVISPIILILTVSPICLICKCYRSGSLSATSSDFPSLKVRLYLVLTRLTAVVMFMFPLIHELQILYAVIILLPVDVVNYFILCEEASNMRLHNQDVFTNVAQ